MPLTLLTMRPFRGFLASTLIALFSLSLNAQSTVDPPGWWADLEKGQVEVLVSNATWGRVLQVEVHDSKAKLLGWRPGTLDGHAWVNLDVSAVKSERKVVLEVITENNGAVDLDFHVHPHLDRGNRLDHWDDAPALYLIMPDRFANGDKSNDDVEGMLERGVDRNEMHKRHGGDLKGITNHLDDLNELGVGAIWLTPVVENDLEQTSYHGYACTDSYAVDPRLGTLQDYKQLVEQAHRRGIRVIHDWVPNHWGKLHRLLTHPVDSAWVHHWEGGFDESKRTNYRGSTISDPHRTPTDEQAFEQGWFDRMMPDMNQTHPDLQRYLATNMLWWMAEVGLDGLRIDTYTYGNPEAMAAMTKRIATAFPESFMFAEAWVYGTAKQAALIEGTGIGWGNETGLDGAVDFAWHFAMKEAVEIGEGWERGIGRVYETLAEDFLYPHPERLVTFLDNHDTHRWIAEAGNEDKAKAGLAMLLMSRGMPCLYYGTELGFATRCEPDGKVRQDMPGGWEEDARNAFEPGGRTDEEQAWYAFVQGLLKLRKRYPEAFQGGMTHFFPKRGVYGFAREQQDARIVTLVNAANEPRPLPWQDLNVWLEGANQVEEMLPDGTMRPIEPLELNSLESWEHRVWVIQK